MAGEVRWSNMAGDSPIKSRFSWEHRHQLKKIRGISPLPENDTYNLYVYSWLITCVLIQPRSISKLCFDWTWARFNQWPLATEDFTQHFGSSFTHWFQNIGSCATVATQQWPWTAELSSPSCGLPHENMLWPEFATRSWADHVYRKVIYRQGRQCSILDTRRCPPIWTSKSPKKHRHIVGNKCSLSLGPLHIDTYFVYIPNVIQIVA